MPSVNDPFARPNGGAPVVLVGRSTELAAQADLVARLDAGRSARGLYYRGCRGSGKTVMLDELASELNLRGWLGIRLRAASRADAFKSALEQAIEHGLMRAYGKTPNVGRLGKSTHVQATGHIPFTGIDVSIDRDLSRSQGLEAALTRLGSAVSELGVPVVLMVDEADYIDRHQAEDLHDILRQFCAYSNDYPTALVVAGASRRLYGVMSGTSTDHEWSSSHQYLRRLSVDEATSLLVDTAAKVGMNWATFDLSPIVMTCAGVPRRLQVAGSQLIKTGVSEASIQGIAKMIAQHQNSLLRSVLSVNDRRGLTVARTLCTAAPAHIDELYDQLAEAAISEADDVIDRLASLAAIEIDDQHYVSLM
jgi:hypothetical protein